MNVTNKNEEKLGMKWYKFSTKVRPWISVVFCISLCYTWINSSFKMLLYSTDYNAALLICVVNLFLTALVVAYMIYNLILFKKARTKISMTFIRKYLIFESFYNVFFTSVYQLGEDEELFYSETWIVWFILLIIDILITYFIWYKKNMEYFEKRLSNGEKMDNQEYKNLGHVLPNQNIHICLSNPEQELKKHGSFYSKDLIVQPTEETHIDKAQTNKFVKAFDACCTAKELSEQSANSLITINRKCCEIGIDYNDRKLAIATFSYIFVQWAYTSKNISFAQFGEVQKLYKEQFNEFNKIAFQDDSFKNVMENEQMYDEISQKLLEYAKTCYDINSNSFSREMIEKYISEFIQNKSDVDTLMKYM